MIGITSYGAYIPWPLALVSGIGLVAILSISNPQGFLQSLSPSQ